MAASGKPRERRRGNITPLPSGALRVRVEAGQDPVTKKPFYLTEAVPQGRRQAQDAEKINTRFLNQVDEGRNPKTRADVDQLMAKYLDVVDVLTLRGYRSKYINHLKPLLGTTPLSKLGQIGTGVEILDSFYAELRRCRLHCDGKTFIQHRTARPHQGDEHEVNHGDPLPPEKTLAAWYGVAASTAHRAVALLVTAGLVTASRGKRAMVAAGDGPPLASVTELKPTAPS